MRPAVDAGIRFLIDPEERLNLRLDIATGEETIKYYFKVAEAF